MFKIKIIIKWKFIFAILLIGSICPFYAQTLFQSQVNTITTTQGIRHHNQMAVLSPDSVFFVFKRGEGTSRPDNTIIAALSFDGGNTFREVDVTEPLYEGVTSDIVYTVRDPRIAATTGSILVTFINNNTYPYDTAYIMRSTDGGETWNKKVVSEPLAVKMGRELFSDGISTYAMGSGWSWAISHDDGITFDTLHSIPGQNEIVTNMAITPGNIWAISHPSSRKVGVYYSNDKGENFIEVGSFLKDFPSTYEYPPVAAHGNNVVVIYLEEIVGIYTLGWKRFSTTGVVDSGVIYEGTNPPAGKRTNASMSSTMWAFEAGSGYELLVAKDNGNTWLPKVKPNLTYDAPDMYSFQLVDSIFYLCGNAFGQIPPSTFPITFWKWRITDVPSVKMMTNPFILENKDTSAIWLEITQYVDTRVKLQIAEDAVFSNLVLDTTARNIFSYWFGVSPSQVGLSNNTADKNFYVRVRNESDTTQTDWSGTLIINFARKNKASVTFVSSTGNHRNALSARIMGRVIRVDLSNDQIREIKVFDTRGRLVIIERTALRKYAYIDISLMSLGKYIVSVIGNRSTYCCSIVITC